MNNNTKNVKESAVEYWEIYPSFIGKHLGKYFNKLCLKFLVARQTNRDGYLSKGSLEI